MAHVREGGQKHHAYVITGESGAALKVALKFVTDELGLSVTHNPDVVIRTYNLFTVEDARKLISLAQQSPLSGTKKALIVVTSRLYHEAQNALLKLFEEPPQGTTLFLLIPEEGQLLPTLRSRVVLRSMSSKKIQAPAVTEEVQQFLRLTLEKRSAYIKKLTSSTSDEERHELRDKALALVNGIEAVAYTTWAGEPSRTALLRDLALLRRLLHDRSSPVKMILEHISLVLPRGLVER